MNKIEQLEHFLQTAPGDSFLMHALALEYIKAGNDGKARGLFEQILAEKADYVGSYYHLAKLLERTGEKELAIYWYQKGMEEAKAAGDRHAYNELQMGYEDIVDM